MLDAWMRTSNKARDLRGSLGYEGFKDNEAELIVMILYFSYTTCSTFVPFFILFICTSALALCH